MGMAVTSETKYERLLDVLKAGLEAGELAPEGRLASEHELSRLYKVSRNTVREAVSSLVQQGYLDRRQGSGTYVKSRRPSVKADSYAILIHAHGHVFDAQTRELVRCFQREGGIPMVFDVEALTTPESVEALLAKVVEQGVTGLVVEEASLLARIEKVAMQAGKPLPLLGVMNYPYAGSLPVKSVISDFRAGVGLGTRHLLEQGRRRVLFAIHRNLFARAGQAPEEMGGLYGEICRGYAEAMAQGGGADGKAYFFVDHELKEQSERQRLRELFRGADRPDALFAFGDYLAKEAVDILAGEGLRVPEDLAVVGYWNTPWTTMLPVPLTSVGIREVEIARVTADRMTAARVSGDFSGETTVIQPELVIRASSGAAGPAGTL